MESSKFIQLLEIFHVRFTSFGHHLYLMICERFFSVIWYNFLSLSCLKGGKVGCRKCLNVGVYIPERRRYYYVNFRQRYRHPAAPRTAEYQLEHGRAAENAQTQTERQKLQRESGVSGVTILFTLRKLYGFDPVNDMVIDRMHMCFNLLRKEFIDKIWPDVGDNADVPVNDRNPADGGLVNREDFGRALDAVQWTREEKARGVARLKSLTDKLGSWKSDEFVK